jgi:hypothetical protein
MRMRVGHPGGRRRRTSPSVVVLTLALTAGGCTTVGAPGPARSGPPSNPEQRMQRSETVYSAAPDGIYQGVMQLDGGQIGAALELQEAEGGTLRAYLQLSTDWVAEGKGDRRRNGLRVELSYDSGCPGTMILTGRWEPASDRLAGEVRASDCTGGAEGTFSFSPSSTIRFRRSPGGRDGRPLREVTKETAAVG